MSGRNRKDVDDLLADLDNLGTDKPVKSLRKGGEAGNNAPTAKKAGTDDAQSLLDDLDTLVQSRATSNSRASLRQKEARTASPAPSGLASPAVTPSATPSKRSTEVIRPSMDVAPITTIIPATEEKSDVSSPPAASWSGWGSSLFSQATKLADQARQELEKRASADQARELSTKGWDLAKNVRGLVKDAGLEKWGEEVTKVGKRGWTDMINAVAPPIAAHEIIQVTLSHDMIGYDGISDVTYQVLAKVMEQVQQSSGTDQQLIVNKAPVDPSASKPKEDDDGQERDLNQVEGFAAAFRLARANLDECIKKHEVAAPPAKTVSAAAAAASLPITTCPVFVRIQACFAPLPGLEGSDDSSTHSQSLFFIILLQDPQHGLSHKTVSQAVPTSWRKFLTTTFPSKQKLICSCRVHSRRAVRGQSLGGRVARRCAVQCAQRYRTGLRARPHVWPNEINKRRLSLI